MKIMNISKREQITVKLNDYEIEEVKEYTYILSSEGQIVEIKRRIQIGWATFRKYKA